MPGSPIYHKYAIMGSQTVHEELLVCCRVWVLFYVLFFFRSFVKDRLLRYKGYRKRRKKKFTFLYT